LSEGAVFIHPAALCESDSIGAGTRIWAFAHVMRGAAVGRDCNICDHAFVETGVVLGDRVTVKNGVLLFEKVTIEDDVFLGPHAVFTNDLRPRIEVRTPREEWLPTLVKKGASIGANATIVCGTTIGEHALIGAGSVVTRDVPAYALMAGNPARRMGWVCACGETLPAGLGCVCGRRYAVDEPDHLSRL
jgi:UDP-2-acetamido-3-amino-2,3-dideoxy-glucuronate N-acetyltransferase